MKQAIYIKYANGIDYFDLDEPITVQRFETQYDENDFDRELVWCNHAQAEEVIENIHIPRIDEQDIEYDVVLYVCKCGAYKNRGETFWQDAPYEGVAQEGDSYER